MTAAVNRFARLWEDVCAATLDEPERPLRRSTRRKPIRRELDEPGIAGAYARAGALR